MAASAELRRTVQERAKSLCEYCLSHAGFCPDPFSVEHIEPESRGGATVSENLAWSCQGCNNGKYNFTTGIDPLTNQETSLYPTGRATIERLRLNRSNVTGWRRLANAFGIHPPD